MSFCLLHDRYVLIHDLFLQLVAGYHMFSLTFQCSDTVCACELHNDIKPYLRALLDSTGDLLYASPSANIRP